MEPNDEAKFLKDLRQSLSDDIAEYCSDLEPKVNSIFIPRQQLQPQPSRKSSAFSLKSPSMRAVLSADALIKAATSTSPTSSSSTSTSSSSTKTTNERTYLSKTEKAILSAKAPMKLNLNDEIEFGGFKAIWANKDEVLEWKGDDGMTIDQYVLNVDIDPLIISKKLDIPLNYVQELAIRYLKPPTPYVFV
jgi:hypothetical protein